MADLISLDWDGKHYELEVDSITAREFKSIRSHTGLKAGQFIRAMSNVDDLDADVAVALLWLFRKRAGEDVAFDDDVAVFKLLAGISRVVADDGEAEEGPKVEDDTSTPG